MTKKTWIFPKTVKNSCLIPEYLGPGFFGPIRPDVTLILLFFKLTQQLPMLYRIVFIRILLSFSKWTLFLEIKFVFLLPFSNF